MENAPSGIDFSFAKVAEPLATLATVLAAFAFASIAVLLSTPPKTESPRRFSRTVYLLLCAFVCLISNSFFFGVTQALRDDKMINALKSSVMIMLASYAFWTSVGLLALAIIWLFEVYLVDEPAIRLANLLFLLVMVALGLSVPFTTLNALSQPARLTDLLDMPYLGRVGVSFGFGATLLVGIPVCSRLLRRRHRAKRVRNRSAAGVPAVAAGHTDRSTMLSFMGLACVLFVVVVGMWLALTIFLQWDQLDKRYVLAVAVVPMAIMGFLFAAFERSLPRDGNIGFG